MLFETPGCENYLSGAILDPETLYQKSSTTDEAFPKLLMDKGIVPGVKPHLKVYALPGQSGSTVMQGLDSLAARCAEYRAAGARFAKWRSPLEIDVSAQQPSDLVIEANMRDLGTRHTQRKLDGEWDALNAPKPFAVFSSNSNFIFRSMCIRALPRSEQPGMRSYVRRRISFQLSSPILA